MPFVFLHVYYQPSVTAGSVSADLSDFAILAAVVAAFCSGLRSGFAPLRSTPALWALLVAFCVWIFASLAWAAHADAEYGVGRHLVSASKFVEYVFLAAAVPLALRRDVDRRTFLWATVAWSSFLTLIGILQFLGVLTEFGQYRGGDREPSYIGIHDLAAFSGAALSVGFASILLAFRRRTGVWGAATGGLGIAIAAALDSVGGMVLSAVVLFGLARRRSPVPRARWVAVLVIVIVVGALAVTLRGAAIRDFLRFIGIRPRTEAESTQIETYAQRTLLGYIGVEIWLHHPVIGVGWQESALPHSFEPYLAGAHKHFHAAPKSFPSRKHHWGVQNGIVQTFADLGIVGALLLAGILFVALRLLVRVAARGPPVLLWSALVAMGWLLFAFAVFTGSGLLPGITVDAQLWLAIGLAVALHNSLETAG